LEIKVQNLHTNLAGTAYRSLVNISVYAFAQWLGASNWKEIKWISSFGFRSRKLPNI